MDEELEFFFNVGASGKISKNSVDTTRWEDRVLCETLGPLKGFRSLWEIYKSHVPFHETMSNISSL